MTPAPMRAASPREPANAAVLPPRISGVRGGRLLLVTALAAAVAALQIAYPVLHGTARDRLTVLIVIAAAAAAIAHAAVTAGARATTVLVGVGVIGWACEVVGVHSGVPFGRYQYTGSLGAEVLGVPVVIGAAWIMMSWPAALVARRLVRGTFARTLVGAWALASWDLFLDPQMVAAGHWSWANPDPHLPGVGTMPVTNFLGWLVISLAISAALQLALRPSPVARDGAMLAFFLWTYASSVLALAVFLGLAAAAAWGAIGMGLVAVPLCGRLWAVARA
jgi:uncharacterized membrane protein